SWTLRRTRCHRVPRIFLTGPQLSPVLILHHREGEQRLHSGKLATSSVFMVTAWTKGGRDGWAPCRDQDSGLHPLPAGALGNGDGGRAGGRGAEGRAARRRPRAETEPLCGRFFELF